MRRVLILCLHRPERSPSQRFRFEQYLPHLEKAGYQFDFSYLLDARDDGLFYQPGELLGKARILFKSLVKRCLELFQIRRYDLVFVQREGFMLGSAFFETAMARKVPMIFDFDDSIWLQNVSEANKRFSFLKNAGKTSHLIQAATLVLAGNEYLSGYARQFQKNVQIVPTTIDMARYQRVPEARRRGPVCIGWSGSFSTIEHFRYAIPALSRIREIYGDRVQFKVIGDGNYFCQELSTQGEPWRANTEIADLCAMDIGIMPLPDDEWAKGKCGLKGLQYMALGIPTLMSPVGVNQEIVQPGLNGFLPTDQHSWVETLSLLIEDVELRQRIGAAGKETVEENYSVGAWKTRYADLFDSVCSAPKLL